MEQQGADRCLPHLAGQGVEGAFAQLCPVLADRGQRRHGVLAQGQVVKADDAQLSRNGDIQLGAVDQQHMRQNVVGADNRRAAPVQKPGQMLLQTF